MSTRYNNGSHYENHQRAAELHDAAAHAHQSAAEAHEKQDHQTGHERSRRALEHSQKAFERTEQAQQAAQYSDRTSPGQAEIAARARELWESRGCPEGSPDEYWFRAEQELCYEREYPRK